ncbi:unnamed protein product [Rotaria sordida]|uniref:Uncharacterized protein n=2 Tax=Rotaria sordida TaxID=392033 RepID=A0A814C4H5_9BILA|nr:unnamed protein product [Rotaria sordida]
MMLITGNSSRPQSLVISDFNNDGLMDIGVVNSLTHNIGIFLGYDNISFANETTYSTRPYLYPCSMAVGDFNNDTRMDIVFGSCDSDKIGVFLGYSNDSFGNLMAYSTVYFRSGINRLLYTGNRTTNPFPVTNDLDRLLNIAIVVDDATADSLNAEVAQQQNTFDKFRGADIDLLQTLDISSIDNSMVEQKRCLLVTSLANSDTENRYRNFQLLIIRYPYDHELLIRCTKRWNRTLSFVWLLHLSS